MSTPHDSRSSSAGGDTAGLHNTRTRLVGTRTGFLADAVVAVVQAATIVRSTSAATLARLATIVTPLGWLAFAGVPLALVLGYVLAWVEFVAVGWAGLTVVAIAVLYLIGRPRIEVSLVAPSRRVAAGDEAQLSLVAENPRRRQRLATTVEIPVADGLVELVVPPLRTGSRHEASVGLPTHRRGEVVVGPVRTVRADPVGLVHREHRWSDELSIIVHPRTVTAPSTSTGLIHDLEGAATRDLSSSDLAFHALREYQPGDERRYIHWKSSAKTGTYMVRQFEQSRRSHLLVALSLSPADFAHADEFELAVSCAASLGARAIRDGRTVSVAVSAITPPFARRRVYGARRLETRRPDDLLDDLALVELDEGALELKDLAQVVASESGRVSVAFLVCGSRSDAARLRAAAAAFPPEVAVVVVMCDPEALPGFRAVGGVEVLAVGLLDDLRQALARSAALR